ncbi:hypothetical protein BDQ17DRAFT_1335698 [Cyathus striatus]|nr:hypothetical protein BDQ17DRAFT_1335698 [Cyathus striatus]
MSPFQKNSRKSPSQCILPLQKKATVKAKKVPGLSKKAVASANVSSLVSQSMALEISFPTSANTLHSEHALVAEGALLQSIPLPMPTEYPNDLTPRPHHHHLHCWQPPMVRYKASNLEARLAIKHRQPLPTLIPTKGAASKRFNHCLKELIKRCLDDGSWMTHWGRTKGSESRGTAGFEVTT